LIATTIDARIVMDKMMDLGLDLHFDGKDMKNHQREQTAIVEAGNGACKIRFEPHMVQRIFQEPEDKSIDNLFGLEYTFTLVEGSDHERGVGDAVNLPEWLTPLPVLQELGEEAGLELEYAHNFHEFYHQRSDPATNAAAHTSLYNMKVLNRNGTISQEEWDISRLYVAVKFRKVRESSMSLDEDGEGEEDDDADDNEDNQDPEHAPIDPAFKAKMLPMALMKAKKSVGNDRWKELSSEDKTKLTDQELRKMATASK